jgi:plastocyanin
MRFSKTIGAILLIVLVIALAGCSGSGSSSGGGTATPPAASTTGGTASTTVVEKNFAFEPASLEVKVGDTVTFKNEDSAPHNVKIDGKDLGNQDPGASVTWTASTAGSFPYTCTIHPSMAGEIVVK